MKLLFAILFAVAFSVCSICGAESVPSHSATNSDSVELVKTRDSLGRLPGVSLAEGLTEITGTAISPLLGVCTVGVYQYYKTPEPVRSSLPWYCQPWAWGPGLSLLALCFLKDTVGPALPSLIKKPFDLVELFENKLSAMVASAAFVPLIASQISAHYAPAQAHLAQTGVQYASVLPLGYMELDIRWLFIPLFMASFLVVWLMGHAINVLIILCPFGVVDTALKIARTSLLAFVVAAYAIHPYLGAGVSVLILLVALWLAPSAFRLMVFGTLFALDTIFASRARRRATPTEAHAFAGASSGVPVRTYGRLIRSEDGRLLFRYRPWLIFPQRTAFLPEGGTIAVARGVFYPSLLYRQAASEGFSKVILFLPRYRTYEEVIAEHLQATDIHDSTLSKGFRAVRSWFGEIFNSRNKTVRSAGAESVNA